MNYNEAAAALGHDAVWLNANRYYDAERRHYEAPRVEIHDISRKANPGSPTSKSEGVSQSSLASEIAFAREKIQNFLKSADGKKDLGPDSILNRLEKLEKGHEALRKQVSGLTSDVTDVLSKLSTIEKFVKTFNNTVFEEVQVSVTNDSKPTIVNGSSTTAADDDLDLFGSDEEDDAAVKLREERLQSYATKKAKKPALVAKSSVVFDVKPWDDTTDMKEVETAVRAVELEGLVWGASKLVPLAYGINKLQIVAIVEDEKVSIDLLQETISNNDDLVQSVDIAAFNKL